MLCGIHSTEDTAQSHASSMHPLQWQPRQGSLDSATPYARCLLDLARVLAAGLPGLAPGQSAAYYSAALCCREKAAILPDAAASRSAPRLKAGGRTWQRTLGRP